MGSGRTNDLGFELAHTALPPGSLRLADRGFVDLGLFADYQRDGVFWLCRLHPGMWVSDAQGRKAKPHEYLQAEQGPVGDRSVWLGVQRLPARLVAVRLSEEAAAAVAKAATTQGGNRQRRGAGVV